MDWAAVKGRCILATVLNPSNLVQAYRQGAFPMADEQGRVDWYTVAHRALFPIEGIYVSQSLAKVIRQCKFEIRFDTAFEQVIRGCFRPDGNWLTNEFVMAYTACHHQGWAHSCEAWDEDGLVGGIYGLAIGSCFSAESMFHRKRDASKVALWALVERCRELGFTVFDAQIMNPHLKSLGAYEVSQREYAKLLREAITQDTVWSTGYPI